MNKHSRNIDDVLWKEAGCTTELDYTEQTSWLLFLKYLDGLEQDKADEAELEGKRYAFILEKPYRWESWAAPKDKDGKLDHNNALTGDDLRDFVNGKLFPYLHGFKQKASGPNTIEYKIGEIFGEIKNKIQSGYNLREIIDHIDELRFRSQTEKHELSHLYEAKIQRMGNAGRNGGEYYTPRPLIRAIVQVVKPKIGERIYDGAVGSAGFLCESFDYLKARRPAHHQRPQDAPGADILRQGEEIARLRHRDHEHDPAWHRSAEHHPHEHAHREPRRHSGKGPLRHGAGQSALRRQGAEGSAAELPDPHGRDGFSLSPTLHQDAQGGRSRRRGHQEHIPFEHRQCLDEPAQAAAGKLQPPHRARLPGGTFQGAGVKTVVLFFEKGAPTRKIWFYQLDPGRNLGKTNPLNDDDLAEFVKLQKTFADSPKSWSVDAKSIDKTTFDLSVKNPNGGEEVKHRSPQKIMDEIAALDAESAEVLEDIRGLL